MNPANWTFPALRKVPLPVWISISTVALIAAAVLSFPGGLGFAKTSRILQIQHSDGFLLSAGLPPGANPSPRRNFLFPDSLVLLEDGKALAHPGSSEKLIVNAGRGRYQVRGSELQFSTSDAKAPDGKTYTVRSPLWSIREPWLLAVWLAALAVCAVTVCLIAADAPPFPTGNLPGALGIVLAAAALIAAVLCFPSTVSDRFFLGLFVPALWAGLMGAATRLSRAAGRTTLLILSLVPALVGCFYYGLNAASDSSFLVGGIIPCSDARVHFQQAAEIAIQGTTQHMFNGRFLYPAFYAAMLDLAGLNMLVANFLVSSLVMVGLALTCPPVSRRVGFSGTAIYCLLFWLYFRAHGCGLLMTENLGLLLGTLGFGFLLLSVDQKSLWPVFASIAFFGLGSAARPGALFILPALALYAGVRAWTSWTGRFRIAASAGAVFLGMVIIAGCFGSNHLVMKSLSRGETKTFGNFAFTLHGLLNNTKWSTSAEQFHWDTSLIMERNIKQITDSPMSLVHGIERAYGEALKTNFLFRFGEEKRFATAGMGLFILSSFCCWLWKPLRGDSAWILLSVAGILASIPFAPPWDAGERPYAVTEPIQIFLAASGAAMLLNTLRRVAGVLVGAPASVPVSRADCHNAAGFTGFAALCFILVLPVPLMLKMTGFRSPVPAESPALLPGSQLLVSGEACSRGRALDRSRYLDRLAEFQAASPDDVHHFTSEQDVFLLAIDWSTLEPVVLPAGQTTPR